MTDQETTGVYILMTPLVCKSPLIQSCTLHLYKMPSSGSHLSANAHVKRQDCHSLSKPLLCGTCDQDFVHLSALNEISITASYCLAYGLFMA